MSGALARAACSRRPSVPAAVRVFQVRCSGLFNVGGRRRTIALAAAAVVGAARPFYVVVEDG